MRERGEVQAHSPAPAEAADRAPAEERSGPDRFAVGEVPPVEKRGAHGAEQPTASQLAFEPDANEIELKTKVGALVAKKYGGDYKQAFEASDSDRDGAITRSELVALLEAASVGNALTRGTWASKIIERLDKTGDAKIQWEEFQSVFTSMA